MAHRGDFAGINTSIRKVDFGLVAVGNRKLESCGKSMVVPESEINSISSGYGSAGFALPFASLTVPQNLLLGSL